MFSVSLSVHRGGVPSEQAWKGPCGRGSPCSNGAFTLPDTDTNTETDTDTDNDKFYTTHFCRSFNGLFVRQCEHTIREDLAHTSIGKRSVGLWLKGFLLCHNLQDRGEGWPCSWPPLIHYCSIIISGKIFALTLISQMAIPVLSANSSCLGYAPTCADHHRSSHANLCSDWLNISLSLPSVLR